MVIKYWIIVKSCFYIAAFIAFLLSANASLVYSQHENLVVEKGTDDTLIHLDRADSILTYAQKYLGTKYKYGSSSPKAFDCSGFTWYVFSHFGVSLPRASYLMAGIGKQVSLKDCRKGDLIFFKGSDMRSKRIGHVGIIISEKGEPVCFIHASINKGVTITSITSSHYKPRFVKVMRIL